jgi:hypothetical protein
VTAPKAPKATPLSLAILRRRVREEMRMPGPDGRPRFKSDAQLARFLGVKGPMISHFLRTDKRGVSWEMVDKLARVFDLQIWQLFFISTEPYKWKTK